jgi:O-antigen/teichoic acid export membrane protein
LLASGDRLLVARLLGPAAAGAYGVGYAIADRSVSLLLAPLAFAMKPAVFKAFDHHGEEATRAATATLAVWLLGLGLPAVIFVMSRAGDLARLLAPPDLAGAGAMIVPWIAVAALFAAFTNFYFALAFQLSRKTPLAARRDRAGRSRQYHCQPHPAAALTGSSPPPG